MAQTTNVRLLRLGQEKKKKKKKRDKNITSASATHGGHKETVVGLADITMFVM